MVKGQFFLNPGKRLTIALAVLTLCSFCVMEGYAQTTGTIYGRVSDSSDAAITGATVTALNLGTDMKRTVTTNSEGEFNFTLLPVGKYQILLEAPGFKNYEQAVELEVQAHLRLNFRMDVGQLTEKVLVSMEAPQVDTASSTLGKVVEQKRIVDLPLNGRNFLQLGVLQAGVTPPIPNINVFGGGTDNTPGGSAVNFSVNGMRVTSNNHVLDGVNNVEPISGAAMIVPSADVLQEFRILTNSYSADYGRAGGSIVLVVTKSGTNNFHGSLYEFLRNDIFDARNFFAPQVPALKQNQFGGTIGGPLNFPRFGEGGPSVYSGKNRTFFFGSYEGFRQRKGIATNTTVPSLLVRQGDFSQEAIKPRDPLTGQPFIGNRIPQDRINPVARNLLEFWPQPTVGSNGWSGTPGSSNDRDQFMARIDHTLIEGKNTLTGRYLIDDGSVLIPVGHNPTRGAIVQVPGFPVVDANRFQNLLIADTHIFSHNVINELRLSYARARVAGAAPANPVELSSLGFTYPTTSSANVFPAINVVGNSALGHALGNSRTSNFYEVLDNVVVNSGEHSIKFGGQIRHSRVLSIFPSLAYGAFTFNGGVSGNSFADFLLGRPFSFFQTGGKEDKNLRQTAAYFYLQDDFRVRRNLTLNLGLRYELVPGFVERDKRDFTFVPGAKSVVSPTLPTGLLLPGDPGVPSTVIQTGKKNFAPRVGLAWDPFGDGKTSIRAGYGLFYDESSLLQNITIAFPPDVQQFIFSILPASFADPFSGLSPFRPPVQYPLPPRNGLSLTTIAPDFKLAYIQHWNITAQRQLTPSLAVEVAYVGNKGSRLQGTIDPNQAIWVPGATAGNAAARRPFPQFATVNLLSSRFNSNYHGLQTTVTQRLNRGLSFQAAYTWSKAIDDTSLPNQFFVIPGQMRKPQDSNNLRAERGLSAYDIRHRFVLSYLYELPFLRGKTGAVSHLLGGWSLSGIASLQSGYPFTIIDTADPSLNGEVLDDRTNVLRNPNLPDDQRIPERWFDTSAFRRFTQPNLGNAGRSLVFSDGIINFDIGLTKNFQLSEQRRMEFRWEVFNVFNHPNFGVPENDFNSNIFGRVSRTSTPERIMQFGLKFLF